MVHVGTRSISIPSPRSQTVLAWALVIALELAIVLAYVTIRDANFGLFHLYPFVWINLGVWAVWKTDPAPASRQRQWIAGGVAAGYFILLGYFGGLFSEGHAHHDHHASLDPAFLYGLELAIAVPPGYGPALFYSSPDLLIALSPYLLVGYLSLTYLVYVAVLDVFGAAVPGLLGLFSCITCSWPILATLATTASGTTAGLATTVYSQAYGISTVAFVLTVGVLYWRPFNR